MAGGLRCEDLHIALCRRTPEPVVGDVLPQTRRPGLGLVAALQGQREAPPGVSAGVGDGQLRPFLAYLRVLGRDGGVRLGCCGFSVRQKSIVFFFL